MKIFLSFLILLINKLFIYNCEISVLKHVQILFRHGDRAPISIFPYDINQADKWSNGLGELTKIGMKQHFHLGMWIRRRYNDVLGFGLNNSIIYVRSTDTPRTLMSAEMNLAGIFYNVSDEVIKGLKWHPFPIHTRKMDEDFLLRGEMCQIYRPSCSKLAETQFYRKKFKPYRKTLEIIRNNTGLPKVTFQDSWTIYDTLLCEKLNNMTLNKWVTEEVWNQITGINDINWEIMASKEMSKLIAGVLLGKIIFNLNSVANLTPIKVNGSKMIIYSGHDSNVAPLATLLGVFDNKQPVYASAIFIELHYIETRHEKWAVQVVYKNYTDSSGNADIPAAIIPGCNSTLCPLSRFVQITKSNVLSVNEYQDICYKKSNILFIVQIIFAVVATGFIVFIILMWVTKIYRKSRGYKYTRVQADLSVN